MEKIASRNDEDNKLILMFPIKPNSGI